MYALINALDGNEKVTVGFNLNRINSLAISSIYEFIGAWDGFDALEESALLKEALSTNDAESAMDLINIMTDKYDEAGFISISKADVILDS
jgi:hypothetical protein